MIITYNNEKYNIRLVDRCDIEFLTNLRNDPEVYENLGNHVFLNSILQEDFIISVSKSDKQKYFIFEDFNSNKIGLIRMTEIDRTHRSVCVGADICKEFRGQGFAKAIYQVIFQIAFNIWGMNRVWLLVLEDNTRAYNLYKKLGFIEEGRHRKARLKNGKFQDYILMGMLQEEYINYNQIFYNGSNDFNIQKI